MEMNNLEMVKELIDYRENHELINNVNDSICHSELKSAGIRELMNGAIDEVESYVKVRTLYGGDNNRYIGDEVHDLYRWLTTLQQIYPEDKEISSYVAGFELAIIIGFDCMQDYYILYSIEQLESLRTLLNNTMDKFDEEYSSIEFKEFSELDIIGSYDTDISALADYIIKSKKLYKRLANMYNGECQSIARQKIGHKGEKVWHY